MGIMIIALDDADRHSHTCAVTIIQAGGNGAIFVPSKIGLCGDFVEQTRRLVPSAKEHARMRADARLVAESYRSACAAVCRRQRSSPSDAPSSVLIHP
jgi:hypothetical protein